MSGDLLEYGARGHLDTLNTQEFERGIRWVVLDDGVTMLIREDCEVILRAQVCLILRSLLVACKGVVLCA